MKCPKCKIELGNIIDEETDEPIFMFCPKCGADLEVVGENELQECCLEILSWIEYRDNPEVINGHTLKVEMKSGDLHYCSSCGKVLGTCTFCDRTYEFPLYLFLNEGKKGAIVLCLDCFNLLRLIEGKIQ